MSYTLSWRKASCPKPARDGAAACGKGRPADEGNEGLLPCAAGGAQQPIQVTIINLAK